MTILRNNRTVLIAVLLLVAGVLMWRAIAPGAAPDPAPLVSVVTAQIQPLPARLAVAGTVTPVDEVDLSVREPGTLSSVSAQIGEHVTKGQALASLDTGELAAAEAAAAARLQVALANGGATARAYDRAAAIRNSGAIAPEIVDQRGADASAQFGEIAAARADLAAAQARLADAVVTAPLSGVIAARAAEPGQYAAPGGPPLFTLIGDAGLELRATIPQGDVPLISPGMTATVAFGQDSVAAQVIGADPRIDPVTHLGAVRIALPKNPGLIAGMFVTACINLGAAQHLVVPLSALVADTSGFHVMVVAGGLAQARPVTLAPLPGNASALVPLAAGIAPGDIVVAQEGAALRNNQPVRPAN